MAPLTQRLVDAVKRYAERNGIEIVSFRRGERKDERTQAYLRRWTAGEGVLYTGPGAGGAGAAHGAAPLSASAKNWSILDACRRTHPVASFVQVKKRMMAVVAVRTASARFLQNSCGRDCWLGIRR